MSTSEPGLEWMLMLLIIWSTQMNVPVRPTPALRRKFMIHLKYSCIDCKPAVDEERSSRPLTGSGVRVEHHVGQLDQLDEVPGVTRSRPVRPVSQLEVDDDPVLPRHPAHLGHVQLPDTIIGCLGGREGEKQRGSTTWLHSPRLYQRAAPSGLRTSWRPRRYLASTCYT